MILSQASASHLSPFEHGSAAGLREDLSATDELSQPQLPPPSFAYAALSSRLESAADSEHSVPLYEPRLRDRILAFAERHDKLTDRLEKLGDVPKELHDVQQALFIISGKVTSQQSRLKTLEEISEEKQFEHARMSSGFAKRLMNKKGSRARSLAQAQVDAEKALTQQRDHERELRRNRERLESTKEMIAELEKREIEFRSLSTELDKIDDMLFGGATPEFPEDDELEWEVKVWQQVQASINAEALREKRARQHLKDAMPNLAAALKDIQKALQHCIDVGVASNTKYTTQLMSNSTAGATVRGVQSLVLNAKTNSGKFFTLVAKARGSQLLVGKPPEFRLIELYLMPGSRNPKAVNERGLHKSLESSYAQAKALDTFLKREINQSLERQRKITSECVRLEEELEHAKRKCRQLRRQIVMQVVRGQHSEADRDARTALTANPPDKEDLLLTNPMVSTNLQQALRKEALTRLRRMITLPDPESEDDDLYPMIA